jgi:hypothetical protein
MRMRKSSYVIAALVAALVFSNAIWLYFFLDLAVGYSYLNDSYRTARATAIQALAIMPVAAKVDSRPVDVIAAAAAADPVGGVEPFDKEGYTWVGYIGLQFGPDGRLIDTDPSVDPL